MSLVAKWCGLCLVTLLMGLMPVHAISARELTAAEQAALRQTIDNFSSLMSAQDWPAMIETTIPPRIINDMLARGKMTKQQLLKSIADLMAETMAKVTIQSYSIDLAKADKRELVDGTPYLLIPTVTVVGVSEGNKVAVRSNTLGMMDAGKWYLLRISDPKQVQMLVQLYPEYKGIEFPGDTTEILKE